LTIAFAFGFSAIERPINSHRRNSIAHSKFSTEITNSSEPTNSSSDSRGVYRLTAIAFAPFFQLSLSTPKVRRIIVGSGNCPTDFRHASRRALRKISEGRATARPIFGTPVGVPSEKINARKWHAGRCAL
ncbi:MAG: hypothetical protein RMK89_13765, partial [Armatimonadota bacterium]|nr:hypothetical protein [Armatimonadota bacterium]MDW8144513.1 hypothetical protein [Armatimonadota bacterium]